MASIRPLDTIRPAATRVAGGLGIGRAPAHENARRLGGNVRVESAPGRGSRFTFWLLR